MALFGRIRICGLNEEGVSLWVGCGVSNVQAMPSLPSLFLQAELLLHHHVCLHATVLPAVMIMDWIPQTISQFQLDLFLYKGCFGHGVHSVYSQQYNIDYNTKKTHTELEMYMHINTHTKGGGTIVKELGIFCKSWNSIHTISQKFHLKTHLTQKRLFTRVLPVITPSQRLPTLHQQGNGK